KIGVSKGFANCSRRAVAIFVGGNDVRGVATGATADYFGDDGSSSADGVSKLFENENYGAFAHDEAVTIGSERAAGSLRVVVAPGERHHVTERCYGEGVD